MSAETFGWTGLDSFLGRIEYTMQRAFDLWASLRQELEYSGLSSNLVYRGLNADRFHSIVKDGSLMRKSLPKIMRIKGEVAAAQMKAICLESPAFLKILHDQVAEMLHNLFAAVDQFHGAFDNPLGERALEFLNSGEYYMEIFYEEYELISGFCQILGDIAKARAII
jgi:hypothetical protein